MPPGDAGRQTRYRLMQSITNPTQQPTLPHSARRTPHLARVLIKIDIATLEAARRG